MQVSESITRKSASNLALAFILLPKEKRAGMAALYAFCREVDDIADEDSAPVADRRARLARWREELRAAFDGGQPSLPVIRELQPVIARYHLPFDLFDELLKGVEMDLDVVSYRNYEELDLYCYRVASVVGLLSIEIFGYKDSRCRDYAIHLGKALQLTNILRDVHNDALRGRVYLPLSELEKYGVRPEEVLDGRYSERYLALAASVGARARGFYRQARESLPDADRRSMATAELMAAVYWRILLKLEHRRFDVFHHGTTKLSKASKIMLILGMWCRLWTGALGPRREATR
jgi:phytoene synthase